MLQQIHGHSTKRGTSTGGTMSLSEDELRTVAIMATAADYYLKVYPIVWTILSFGNLLSLIVFLQKEMRRIHSNVYLAFLAVADMIFTNTPAWSGIQEFAEGGLTPNNMKFWAKGKVWEYFLQASAILTGWLLVVISIDRFVMVFFPLWSKAHLTVRKAFIFTLLTSLPFIIYPVHNLIGRDGQVFFSEENTSHDTRMFAEKFISEEYEHFYLATHYKIIAPILHISFLVPLFVLNAAIIYKLSQHSRNRSKNLGLGQSSNRESIRITIMLVTVNIIALLLRLPFVILHIIAIEPYTKREFDVWWLAFWFLVLEVAYSLSYLNSCINFFIYISLSSNFKKHFIRVFCPCLKKDQGKLHNGRHEPQSASAISVSVLSESTHM